MHGFVAIVLNFNHTTVYANCVIACSRPKPRKCANTESRAMTMVVIVTARFLVETNLDEVLAVHHKTLNEIVLLHGVVMSI